MTIKIKPLTKARFIPPVKGTPLSAAFDVVVQEDVTITSEPQTIALGFATELPEGYAAILQPRSGLGNKKGLRLRGTLGLIDNDYRGEWLATVVSDETIELTRGDRFLQFYLIEIPDHSIEVVSELSSTERGQGGYGSTGK